MSCAEVPEYVQAQQNNNINGKCNKNSTDTEKATERKMGSHRENFSALVRQK